MSLGQDGGEETLGSQGRCGSTLAGPVIIYYHPRANLGAPRAAATLRSPPPAEHKACAVRQSHRGRAPPAGRTAQGRSHSGRRQGPRAGEMWDLWPLTVRAALLPGNSGGHRADTLRAGTLLPESQRDASAPAADASLSSSPQQSASLTPGKKRRREKKKKSPGQQSLESLC